VTGIKLANIATKIALGHTLAEQGYKTGIAPEKKRWYVKVPVFSFEKLAGVDVQLGPEMKSTGEVLGIAKTFEEALLKGLVAAGYKLGERGGVLITVRDTDKPEIVAIAEKFEQLGFTLYATPGTALVLNQHMVAANSVRKMSEPSPNVLDLLESGQISYVISTSKGGPNPAEHQSVRLRRRAIEQSIACLTALDTAAALAGCLATKKSMADIELVSITDL
ncbi:MAG: carbamoyl-phosphate synthase large subunit, partial [Oscillospiraceae bacterium]